MTISLFPQPPTEISESCSKGQRSNNDESNSPSSQLLFSTTAMDSNFDRKCHSREIVFGNKLDMLSFFDALLRPDVNTLTQGHLNNFLSSSVNQDHPDVAKRISLVPPDGKVEVKCHSTTVIESQSSHHVTGWQISNLTVELLVNLSSIGPGVIDS